VIFSTEWIDCSYHPINKLINHEIRIPIEPEVNNLLNWTMEELENIVKEKMSDIKNTAHSYGHVERVCKIATLLAEREDADLKLVRLGSILHDIGRAVGEPHNETGARLASEVLRELGYPEEMIEKVARIVFLHRQSLGHELETLEERIVWDADKIDLIGVTGVLRAFHWAGTMRISFEDEVKWCRERQTVFYDLLKTDSAKEIARSRQENMMRLIGILEKELALEDLQS
jgi:uncharacterized protein